MCPALTTGTFYVACTIVHCGVKTSSESDIRLCPMAVSSWLFASSFKLVWQIRSQSNNLNVSYAIPLH